MTSITGNAAIDALATKKASTSNPNSALDQTAFLKLMTTQLQTQDPFDPIDNTQMVAQMAQFSSVTGIAEMNASLKQIADDIGASRVGDAASWIGRAALVPSDITTPVGGSYAGQIALADDADSLDFSLVDANGQTVYAKSLGPEDAGELSFAWDGKDAAGATVADGPLTILVSARNATGAVEHATSAWTPVTGVQSPASGAPKLVTPLGLIATTDVQSLG